MSRWVAQGEWPGLGHWQEAGVDSCFVLFSLWNLVFVLLERVPFWRNNPCFFILLHVHMGMYFPWVSPWLTSVYKQHSCSWPQGLVEGGASDPCGANKTQWDFHGLPWDRHPDFSSTSSWDNKALNLLTAIFLWHKEMNQAQKLESQKLERTFILMTLSPYVNPEVWAAWPQTSQLHVSVSSHLFKQIRLYFLASYIQMFLKTPRRFPNPCSIFMCPIKQILIFQCLSFLPLHE